MHTTPWQAIRTFFRKPKQLFLIDGLGGCLTVLCLLGVLSKHEASFGVPPGILYVLAGIGACCAVYSLICYGFVGKRWRFFLRLIAFINLAYCALTMGITLWLYPSLTLWGVLYFALEVLVISSLALLELRCSQAPDSFTLP